MHHCIDNISNFIHQWGIQLQIHPDYENHFENSLIGNYIIHRDFFLLYKHTGV